MLKRRRGGFLTIGGARLEAGVAGEIQLETGHTPAGQPVRIPVRVVRGEAPGPRLALFAGFRSDEGRATQALLNIASRVVPEELGGDVLAVPTANLLGAEEQERARLARSFPGDPRGGAADRHAHVLSSEILRQSDLAVVVSAAPSQRSVLPHVLANLDSIEATRLAHALHVAPIVHDRARPGTVREAAAALGCTAVEYEMGRFVGPARTQLDTAVRAIESVLGAYAMRQPDFAPPTTAPLEIRRTLNVRSSASGLVELRVVPGEVVHEGDVLAEIISPTGGRRELELAPEGGLVLSTNARSVATEGTPLVWLGLGVDRFSSPLVPLERRILLGWSEWVGLPDLGIPALKAKIDTGARTCALHVASIRKIGEDARGRTLVELLIPLGTGARPRKQVTARTPVLEMVSVRDSGGHLERRPLIETTLEIGGKSRRVRVTLTYRGDMRFPMLIGRTGLDRGFLIDATARYLAGRRRKR